MKVMGRSSIQKVEVRADGSGLSSRAGTALLPLAAERLGLTDALGWALTETRERRSGHDPGRVFCDLAVMLADGGRCVSDLVALGSQPALFGDVASVSTARRVLLSVGEEELDRLRRARAQARARAWALGAAPEEVIQDFDATPSTPQLVWSRRRVTTVRRGTGRPNGAPRAWQRAAIVSDSAVRGLGGSASGTFDGPGWPPPVVSRREASMAVGAPVQSSFVCTCEASETGSSPGGPSTVSGGMTSRGVMSTGSSGGPPLTSSFTAARGSSTVPARGVCWMTTSASTVPEGASWWLG